MSWWCWSWSLGSMGETQGRARAGSHPDLGLCEVTLLLLLDEVRVASPILLIGDYRTQKSLPRTCRKQALGTQASDRWVCLSQPEKVCGRGSAPRRSWKALARRGGAGPGRAGRGGAGRGTGRLTRGLGFSGEMPRFLSPGCGVSSHAPVTPCPNLIVLGCHLDDVLLPCIGICDGVRCAI